LSYITIFFFVFGLRGLSDVISQLT